MKTLILSLLIGAAVGTSPSQHILQSPNDVPSSSKNPLHNLPESLKSLSGEARAIWDEVAGIYPEAMREATSPRQPKKHTRRADSYWDYIIKGTDIQKIWVESGNGEKEREIDGDLEAYMLRARKVDPGKLGVDPGVKQYSGYLDDEENDKHLFYWFFESRNDPKNDPVVLWLSGGPGCSSLVGLFAELGPSSIGRSIKPVYNPYSWNSNASIIFLDQPVNAGFSYSSDPTSSTLAASKDVYALLTLFFKQFPEYSHQDFHIAGESYAGHYIPVFTSEILRHKKRNINIKSILIGNGLTDVLTQYEYYRPMACGDGGWPAVLDEGQCQSMDDALPRCQALVRGCYKYENLWTCLPAAIYCNNALIMPYYRTGQNPYDVRVPCGKHSLCYEELDLISGWLNKREVQDCLGAEVHSYDNCNQKVNIDFQLHGDWAKPIHHVVPSILEEIPALIYAGDADFVCNWLGNHAWTEALDWPGKKAYDSSDLRDLNLNRDGRIIGQLKSSGNLTFARIYAAGHMVPLDQPEAGLDLLNRWIGGEWY